MRNEQVVERSESELAVENLRYVLCRKCKAKHIVHVSWLEPTDMYMDCPECRKVK